MTRDREPWFAPLRQAYRWCRLWFVNSYELRRSYPGHGWQSSRPSAIWRGACAVVAGIQMKRRQRREA